MWRSHKKRAGDWGDWKREQSQIEDRLVCTKWKAGRWEERNRVKGQEKKRETDKKGKGKRKRKRGRVKRSWSGYETNSDLIWSVYDSVFSFFFPGTEMQAGIRLGGGLGRAQREERDGEMGPYCTVPFTQRCSSVCTSGRLRNSLIHMHPAWITEVLLSSTSQQQQKKGSQVGMFPY